MPVRIRHLDHVKLYTHNVVNIKGEDIAACDVNLKHVTGVQQQQWKILPRRCQVGGRLLVWISWSFRWCYHLSRRLRWGSSRLSHQESPEVALARGKI